MQVLEKSKSTEFSGVPVEPVAWLDDIDFAEAHPVKDGYRVYVSDKVSLDSHAVQSRLERLIGNLRGETLVGDEHFDLAFQ